METGGRWLTWKAIPGRGTAPPGVRLGGACIAPARRGAGDGVKAGGERLDHRPCSIDVFPCQQPLPRAEASAQECP